MKKREKHTRAARAEPRPAYSIDAASELTGVHPELIRFYCSRGIVAVVPARTRREPVFDDDAIYELRRIEHYRRHFGVNRSALAFIGGLLREVARLEDELRYHGHR
jgi:hypothetical protein